MHQDGIVTYYVFPLRIKLRNFPVDIYIKFRDNEQTSLTESDKDWSFMRRGLAMIIALS